MNYITDVIVLFIFIFVPLSFQGEGFFLNYDRTSS